MPDWQRKVINNRYENCSACPNGAKSSVGEWKTSLNEHQYHANDLSPSSSPGHP